MKNLTKLLFAVSIILIVGVLQAQTQNIYEPKKIITIDGSEQNLQSSVDVIEIEGVDHFNPVHGNFYTYNFHNITDIKTGYDLQSNASTQEVWYDLNRPGFIHSIFTNSQEPISPWSDRTTLYFGSIDDGVTWFELGPVPYSSRCGFPAIHGNSSGAAVITNHNAFFGSPTRATVFIDNSPFEYNITAYDPGVLSSGPPIWPRHTVYNDDVIFAASQSGGDSMFVNVLNPSIPAFLGYQGFDGDQAEQYAFAVSDGGKIGLAFNGQQPNDGDVFYSESTDGGSTWTSPLKIFDRPDFQDTSMGAIRGISCNFYGEQPSVVFEICTQIFSSGNYFPGLPNEIHFWSPNVNSGVSKAIVDSNNVPFAPSLGTNDVQVPYCRPVIGRSETGGFLFVAFDVATADVFPGADPTTYFAGYLMISGDGGNNWTVPEKFTPDSPLRDWRYISIASINPVGSGMCTVHMVVQGDSIPGSTVNASGMPVGVTAQYYHVSTEPIIVPVELISFTAQLNNDKVELNWQTAAETNNLGFEIERIIIREESEGNWITIGFKEGHGTTTEPQEYSYYDDVKDIKATSFMYRLKQIDYNGSYEYSEEITVENSIANPKEFVLSQNYPNPFNPSTSIEFELPVKSFVSLVVFDAIGNEVTTLVNEEKMPGFYEVNFNAANLVSGVYFYKLQAGSFVETKKMLLLK